MGYVTQNKRKKPLKRVKINKGKKNENCMLRIRQGKMRQNNSNTTKLRNLPLRM